MAVLVDRSLRLSESQYFAGPERKSGIAIHHTVGTTARATFELWRADAANGTRPRLVGTAYIVDRDGTVFELFDPTAWAYQFGLRWTGAERVAFERRFIGIELASEGGLLEHAGQLYCFGQISPRTRKARDEAFDSGSSYRGYRWFDRYEAAQIDSLGRLVDELCARFSIPRRYPEQPFDYYGDALERFDGVIGHAMVRLDKSDPAPDQRLWNALQNLAAVRPATVTPPVRPGRNRLTSTTIEALFAANTQRLGTMPTAAGSLIKALVMELERRHVYIRLGEPDAEGHAIGYEIVAGDVRLIPRIGYALGLARVTDNRLEVRHA